MSTTPEQDAQIAAMTFASIYPHSITKIKKYKHGSIGQVAAWIS
jgi:hypothetical protein